MSADFHYMSVTLSFILIRALVIINFIFIKVPAGVSFHFSIVVIIIFLLWKTTAAAGLVLQYTSTLQLLMLLYSVIP